jgi:hypothetical protein
MEMRFLSTRNHGLIGSMAIAAALTAPVVLRLDDVPASSWTLRLWGTSGNALAATTDFELGAVRVIPMPAHLAIDVVMGASLATGPWLLGGATAGRRHWLPHALVGGTEILLAFVIRTRPADR